MEKGYDGERMNPIYEKYRNDYLQGKNPTAFGEGAFIDNFLQV